MKQFMRAEGVSVNPMDDDLFLVAPISGEIVHLDVMAAAIWRLLDEPRSVADILATFVAAFPDANSSTLQDDLEMALETLTAAGLVKQSDG